MMKKLFFFTLVLTLLSMEGKSYFEVDRLDSLLTSGDLIQVEKQINIEKSEFLKADKSNEKGNYAFLIGEFYRQKHQYALAQYYYHLSSEIYSDLKNQSDKFNSLLGEMKVLRMLEKYEDCVQAAYDATSIAKQLKEAPKIAEVNALYGSILLDIEEDEDAEKLLLEAKAYYESQNNNFELAILNLDLSYLYATQNKFEIAFPLILSSIDTLKQYQNNEFLLSAYSSLALTYEFSHDLENALLAGQKAIDFSEKWEIKKERNLLYESKADWLMELQRYDEALIAVKKARILGNELQDPEADMQFYSQMKEYHQVKNQPKEALQYSDLYLEAKEAFDLNYNLSKIQQLKIKHQAEQELKKVQAEKERQIALEKEKLFQSKIYLGMIATGSFFLVVILIIVYKKNKIIKKDNVELNALNHTIQSQKSQLSHRHEKLMIEKEKLEEQLTEKSNFVPDFIILKTSGIKLFYHDICLLESDSNYVKVYTKDSDHPIIERSTLSSLAELFPDNFIKIHRSRIVNRDLISTHLGKYELQLSNQMQVTISRGSVKEVSELLGVK